MRRGKWLQRFHEVHGKDPAYLTARQTHRIMEVLLRRMEEVRKTQAAVAEQLGVSQPHVAQLMKGRPNITLRSLISLAGALDLDVTLRFRDRATGALYADTGQSLYLQWSGPGAAGKGAGGQSVRAYRHAKPSEAPWEPMVTGTSVAVTPRERQGAWEYSDVALRDAA